MDVSCPPSVSPSSWLNRMFDAMEILEAIVDGGAVPSTADEAAQTLLTRIELYGGSLIGSALRFREYSFEKDRQAFERYCARLWQDRYDRASSTDRPAIARLREADRLRWLPPFLAHRVCSDCGVQWTPVRFQVGQRRRDAKFCSRRCWTRHHRRHHRRYEIQVRCCRRCGTHFLKKPEGRRRKFCSASCYQAFTSTARPRRDPPVACPTCGAQWCPLPRSGQTLKFCSARCRDRHAIFLDRYRVSRCPICGAEWCAIRRGRGRQIKYCSTSCRVLRLPGSPHASRSLSK